MEGNTHEPERSAQAEEAAARHLNWRCDHYHFGGRPDDIHVGPAPTPHRHVPFQQEALDLEGDLLGFDPVRWTIEWAGPERRCRGIEVVSPDELGGWVADPGHPTGQPEPVAARLRHWL
jgi:hypothetical protein